MSKEQFTPNIDKELERINQIIDFKIIHGVDYRNDAKRHRKLLIHAARAQRRKVSNPFNINLLGLLIPTLQR